HRQWRRAGCQPGAVADTEQMRVHRDGGLPEPDIEHHIGRLAADAGQGLERLPIRRHLAAMLLEQDPAEGKDVLRFAAIKPDRADQLGNAFNPERHHGGGRGGQLEQVPRRLVHPDIGRLGRKHHRDQEREGIAVVELALGLGLDFMEAREDGFDIGPGQALHFSWPCHSLASDSAPIVSVQESAMPMQATTTTPLFSAALRPDRSPRVAGGWIALLAAALMAAPLGVAMPELLLPGGVAFLIAIAWLSVMSIQQSRRRRLVQEVRLWADQLEVTSSDTGGVRTMRRFDPKSVRLVLQRDHNERVLALHLRQGSEQVELGAFLGGEDKSSFAKAFGTALRRARVAA